VTKIDVSIAAFGQQTTPAGLALGFSPLVTTLTVGSGVQFVNVDNTSHTATSLPPSATFPATSPLTFTATTQSGATLSGGWSSGTMQAGQSSQILLVDRAGTYLYGCFFHYSGTMRGEIIAQ
jgi:plastocyanin